ncbi:MAG: acetate/propionate family kinase [Magnetococcales bacterium]|nr:acetate/propionate family kinase [Magnetococcales bacterium]MBF0155708.1 acetate/propionate family kinase [Magnetococcales bacterium]
MSDPSILVINAGSSSLKFSLFEPGEGDPRQTLHGQIEGIGAEPRFSAAGGEGVLVAAVPLPSAGKDHEACLGHLLEWLAPRATVAAAGHRVVHGGTRFRRPVRVDAEVIDFLAGLSPLAPLHQPHNLAGLRAMERLHPGLLQVACFDTAFHADKRPEAAIFPLPRTLTEAGIRRYGFHGLSYEYIARVMPTVDPKAAIGRVVVAHLGSGASMCAMKNGRGVDSSMGFTAADGLPMGTRCGSLDPGVILYLASTMGWSLAAIEKLIYQQSGLKGVSGISNDMRILLASGEASAREAVDLFVYRIQQTLGALAASLEGLDAVVFTAGIGERSAEIRRRVLAGCRWLGIELDVAANAAGGPRLTTPGSPVAAWVIPTNEELMIARHTGEIVAAEAAAARDFPPPKDALPPPG